VKESYITNFPLFTTVTPYNDRFMHY